MEQDDFARIRDQEFAKVEKQFRSTARAKRAELPHRGGVEAKPSPILTRLFRLRWALASALAAILIFGLGVLMGSWSIEATPLWQIVPSDYHPAKICAQGGLLEDPVAIGLTPAGDILVADSYNDAIIRIPSDCSKPSVMIPKAELEHNLGFELTGAADGPVGLAFNSTPPWRGLFIAIAAFERQGRGRILHYDPYSGDIRVLAQVPLEAARDMRYGIAVYDNALYIPGSDGYVYRLSLGSTSLLMRWKQLSSPTAIAVDAQGDTYVADEEESRIHRFLPDGSRDPEFEVRGLESATGLAFGPAGTLFVAESGAGGRIQRYGLVDGAVTEKEPFRRFSQDQLMGLEYKYGFQGPTIIVSPSGVLFVADNTGEPGEEGKLPTVYKIVPKR